ncbi:MAG: Ig-like domain-containing protein [Planctomycetes bacterium]|nr:Ig-like domain-containing protein [Planctomycetota bacterium]
MKDIMRLGLTACVVAFCGGCGPLDSILPDIIPPFVIDVSPSDGGTGVSVDTDISVTFSETMDPATINPSSFTVSGVSGAIVCETLGMVATFTPDSPLAAGTLYTVTLTTEVADSAGNSLTSDYTWSFETQ